MWMALRCGNNNSRVPFTLLGCRGKGGRMRYREIRELIRMRPFEPDHDRRVISRCFDVADLRREARRRLPGPVFGYLDGAADDEFTKQQNEAAFRRWEFRPRVLRDVSEPDLSVSVLGADLPAPLGLAATGFTRIFHQDGELAVAAAAASRGLPYGLSTVGTHTIEDLAATGHQDLWFQLYVLRDRPLAEDLVKRAAVAGYRALEITVDTPVGGRRTRDLRSGYAQPPALTTRALLDIASRPGYWTSMLRGPALRYASFTPVGNTIAGVTAMFDTTLNWEDVDTYRALWPGALLLKGPLGPEDAARAVAAGVDGIHLSNHGGRQLDRCVPPIDLVRPVREAVGDRAAVVVVHAGMYVTEAARITRGMIVQLLGWNMLGAALGLVGRAYLHGLAAAGQAGAEYAIDLLTGQLRRTMQQLGVSSIAELRQRGDELVTPRP